MGQDYGSEGRLSFIMSLGQRFRDDGLGEGWNYLLDSKT